MSNKMKRLVINIQKKVPFKTLSIAITDKISNSKRDVIVLKRKILHQSCRSENISLDSNFYDSTRSSVFSFYQY